MLESFTLEGVNYSQQYRKCGKSTCATCGKGGPGHGPYWYARDQVSGARRYIGRELPPALAGARQATRDQARELARLRDLLRQEAAALDRLLHSEPLSTRDREYIARLGFGACLVTRPGGAGTQDLVARAGQDLPQDARLPTF